MMNRLRPALVLGSMTLASLAASCSSPGQDVPSSVHQTAIVSGSAESGWPAVGALTETLPGQGYAGSFCTGTAIAPEWVLISASCLETSARNPKTTFFYVGADATPDTLAGPATGAPPRRGSVPHPPELRPAIRGARRRARALDRARLRRRRIAL